MAAFCGSRNLRRNSSSSDESDASGDESPWKRKCGVQLDAGEDSFVNPLAGTRPDIQIKPVKFNIWRNVITDQTVTGDLGSFDLVEEKKSDTLVSRDVETYRVTAEAVKKLYPGSESTSYQDLDAEAEDDMEEESDSDTGDDFMKMLSSYKKAKDEWTKMPADLREKLRSKKRKKNDLREKISLSKAERMNQQDTSTVYTSEAKFRASVPRASPTDPKEEVLQCILETLEEKNTELFSALLDGVGLDKGLDLLSRTEDVETAGGMMINSGLRRRTPGGVYIQLLRADPDIPPDTLRGLFPPQHRDKDAKHRRKKEARRRKRMTAGKTRDGEMESLMNVNVEAGGMGEVELPDPSQPEDGEIVSD